MVCTGGSLCDRPRRDQADKGQQSWLANTGRISDYDFENASNILCSRHILINRFRGPEWGYYPDNRNAEYKPGGETDEY